MTNPAPTPNQMPGAQASGGQGAQPDPAAPQPPVADAPVPAPASAPAGAPAPAAAAPTPPWGSPEEFNPERAWSLIQNLRAENADAKTKLTEAQPILDAHEQSRRAEQGELSTAREDLVKANQRGDSWRDRAVRAEARALADTRFIDADAALALIGDVSDLATDTGVDTTKLQQRLDQLATDKPHLVKSPAPQGFTPNRGQGQSGNGPLTSSQLAAHADSQQDWKAAGIAKAQQLIDLRK